MMERMREAARQVASMLVTRGKVKSARLGGQRTVLQVTVLRGEVKEGVELVLPPGMSHLPLGGDALIFQVNGMRDHLVAFVDDPSTRIRDLKAGELGWRDANGAQIVLRSDHIEVTGAKLILDVSGDCVINATGNAVLTTGGTVQLGGAGGKKVVLDGDPTSDGAHCIASSTKVLGT